MNARYRLLAVVAACVLALVGALRGESVSDQPAVIRGPLALLLASSSDLGPSSDGDAQLTVTLADSTRPEALIEWARAHDMWVRWRPGDEWAIVEGAAQTTPRHGRRDVLRQAFEPVRPKIFEHQS